MMQEADSTMQGAANIECKALGTRSQSRFRIVIVGCGPKGLYCLERLAAELSKCTDDESVTISILDPAEFFGAGAVYHPGQPSFLRMNFAAKYIDAWPSSPTRRVEEKSLCDWLSDKFDSPADGDAYVPRRLVGEYLHDCYNNVKSRLTNLPCVDDVEIIHEHVLDIEHTENQESHNWRVSTKSECVEADEVLLTVGHEGWRPAALLHKSTIKHIPVFPVESNLSVERIPSGSFVAIRGFGLTAIDAMLAMTEGRDGEFERTDARCIYHRSGSEPDCILPHSRSGRPMLAKPVAGKMKLPSGLKRVWSDGRKKIHAFEGGISPDEWRLSIWPVICDSAAKALNVANGTSGSESRTASNVDDWYRSWVRNPFNADSCLTSLVNSLSVAMGRQPTDIAWAIGEAWRQLYPTLVEAISYGRMHKEAWRIFQPVAAEMERIAFGPPAENVSRILALIEAEVVDLSFLNRGDRWLPDSHTAGIHVDAVLPSTFEHSMAGPLSRLIERGYLQRLNSELGIHIDPAGRPVVENEVQNVGLAVIGRPTEGCVLGNDTLSRTLHDHPARWASSVIQRIQIEQSN